jgi:hypothetical protein
MCSKPHSMLIMACSQRKRSNVGLLSAIERYDGPTFRLLRRFLREQPSERLDTYVLSAEFGLIPSDQLIPNYDRRMTLPRAQELHPGVIAELRHILSNQSYRNICICMGREYLRVLDGYDTLISSEISIKIVGGSPGEKLAELHNWLYGKLMLQRHIPQSMALLGRAQLRMPYRLLCRAKHPMQKIVRWEG